MENPTVSGLRSRSRSKTPFLRSSCDHENCAEGEEHTHHKSGRKTPVRRSTPVKQVVQSVSKRSETITEEEESAAPAHRTRLAARHDQRAHTSDYSSEESLDRLKGHGKEIFQNEINSQYERVSTSTSSQRYTSLSDVTLSPIHAAHSITHDRSRSRIGSPAYSACSTDSSFAEQALHDASLLLEQDPDGQHLPSRLYKMAREYWNKYPKTDYTYSRLSKDRVELAPGQVAMPNMSRRSLSQFRIQGPSTSADELDRLSTAASWTTTSTMRKRYTSLDSSDDETAPAWAHNGVARAAESRSWLMQLIVSIITTVTTTTSNTYRKIVGPSHRYPYTDRRPAKVGVWRRAAAPVVWLYALVSAAVTSTVTTVTETFTSPAVEKSEKYAAHYADASAPKRRWWPWLLLLLLPALGYGCYKYSDQILPASEVPVDTYRPAQIVADPDLAKRLAALERWALGVDARLTHFDQKLSQLDNLEAQIEQYSIKHLQNNLIRVFSANDNAAIIADKLRKQFEKDFITAEQVQAISKDIEARVASSWRPGVDEDTMRRLIQEYLAVFERRQLEIIKERVHEYVKEVEVRGGGDVDLEAVRRLVAGMLEVYDADKTGLVDYALESAGGQVLSTRCTELYQIKTKQYSVLGVPVLWVYTSPRNALTPGAMPAECWAFQGFPGYLVVRTYAIIEVTGFSLEHMSRLLAVDGKIESAPKNFSVYGLHGEQDPAPHHFGSYTYDAAGAAIQYFAVQHAPSTDIGGVLYPVAYDIVELRVESNHGNPTYTCVYRFRVHGNPLSDVRQAARDSIRDSET